MKILTNKELTRVSGGSCKIACYSDLNEGIREIGTIVVDGSYDSRGVCQPKGYEGVDISGIDSPFSQLCAHDILYNGIWAGGHTGMS